MQTQTDYILIIHTGNDLLIEEDIDGHFDIDSYMKEMQVQFHEYELITKHEFNKRLDQMLGEY
ncbi:hypothetical protein [Paenibacillus agricola]|uniref:Uncharacterized protein n=1 Tax=Paenibacillus agricola TaxID=2716264 RepID=A0ABX0J798_9BACL|nr:hypothetical protein [Paenibacillus agricola]NHN31838.1 hypothetical protein [Paenibacillus agricola]